jgi:hypothetical protein
MVVVVHVSLSAVTDCTDHMHWGSWLQLPTDCLGLGTIWARGQWGRQHWSGRTAGPGLMHYRVQTYGANAGAQPRRRRSRACPGPWPAHVHGPRPRPVGWAAEQCRGSFWQLQRPPPISIQLASGRSWPAVRT